MFTLDWSWENKGVPDLNFSETPEHKCAHLFKMENGNYYVYPNNRIIWFDDAWTFNRIDKNPGFEIDTTVYSVENKRRIETSDHFMYEITDLTKEPLGVTLEWDDTEEETNQNGNDLETLRYTTSQDGHTMGDRNKRTSIGNGYRNEDPINFRGKQPI